MGTNYNVGSLVVSAHRITPASSASSGTKMAILVLLPIPNQEQLPYEGDKYKIYRRSFMGRITPQNWGQNKLTAVNLVEVALVVHAATSKT